MKVKNYVRALTISSNYFLKKIKGDCKTKEDNCKFYII